MLLPRNGKLSAHIHRQPVGHVLRKIHVDGGTPLDLAQALQLLTATAPVVPALVLLGAARIIGQCRTHVQSEGRAVLGAQPAHRIQEERSVLHREDGRRAGCRLVRAQVARPGTQTHAQRELDPILRRGRRILDGSPVLLDARARVGFNLTSRARPAPPDPGACSVPCPPDGTPSAP